jgi:hypothetical protein
LSRHPAITSSRRSEKSRAPPAGSNPYPPRRPRQTSDEPLGDYPETFQPASEQIHTHNAPVPIVTDPTPEEIEYFETQTERASSPPPNPDPESDSSDDSDEEDNMPKEINIGKPFEFDGNRDISQRWLEMVFTYLDINEEIYNDDKRKIIFALSFMTKKSAATWASDFIEYSRTPHPTLPTVRRGYGTWDDFLIDFNKTFDPIDSVGTAMAKLNNLRQGDDLGEYLADFRSLCARAKITDFSAKKDYLFRGLKNGLLQKLCDSGEVPDNYEALIKKISNIDSAYHLLLAHKSRNNNRNSGNQRNSNFRPRYNPPARDSNAMDIDRTDSQPLARLTPEEKDKLFKAGACFKCRKPGHRANACPTRQNNPVRRETIPEEDDEQRFEEIKRLDF